ncbi:MAG: hypothetical protein B6I20_05430 [Bacteroidetes bacterium 4572_117]|nr:MAG: hypothetical protein B6I20_05430 [Bacteroidetes bacterium 4572_117]
MTEHYNDILCIEAGWMTGEGGILGYDNLHKLKKRGHLKQLRKGGNGRTALIEYDSIPARFKAKIIEKIGDPRGFAKHQQFRKHLVPDRKAIEYFGNYKLKNGQYLPTEKAKEYHTNAMFLNALDILPEKTLAYRKNRGGNRAGIWQALTDVVNDLKNEFGHSLPGNQLRLRSKLKTYNTVGYLALIHRNYGNQYSRKVDEMLERLILSIYVMNNKPYINMVLDIYLAFLAGKNNIVDVESGEIFQRGDFWNDKRGTYITVSDATVWNYINNPKNRPVVDSKRNDSHYFNNLHRPHHHRRIPDFSLSKISFDDRDLVRKMKDAKGHTMRAKAYYVYDVTSGALIGYAHSKNKDSDLFISCLRNMFTFLHKNNIGMPMEAEVEHHLVNQYQDDMMKAGVVFPFVRFCNPGNSQEKRSEHFIKAKKYGYEKRYQTGIGRYTLSEANRPKQDKEWKAEGMSVKEKYYTYEQLVADDIYTINKYNEDLHPNQKKHKGMSRMDVLKMKLNANLVSLKEELLARYIGNSTETSVRRNQYVRVQYEKYQLPNFDVLGRLKPNNYKVTAYYLPDGSGNIDNVHLYQGLEFIGTCNKITQYNEATAEQTDEDLQAYQDQAKYVSQFDKKIKEGRKNLSKLKIVENEDYKEPETVEIHQSQPIIDDWGTDYSNAEYERQDAVEDL